MTHPLPKSVERYNPPLRLVTDEDATAYDYPLLVIPGPTGPHELCPKCSHETWYHMTPMRPVGGICPRCETISTLADYPYNGPPTVKACQTSGPLNLLVTNYY